MQYHFLICIRVSSNSVIENIYREMCEREAFGTIFLSHLCGHKPVTGVPVFVTGSSSDLLDFRRAGQRIARLTTVFALFEK